MKCEHFSSLFLLFVILMSSSRGQLCEMSRFTVSSVCDTQYGTLLSTGFVARSAMDCARNCSNDVMCQSATFDDTLSICQTNAGFLEASNTNCTEQVSYAALDSTSTSYSQSTVFNIFSPCLNNTECTLITDTECRNEKCQCVPGLSYDPSTVTCIPDCGTYGTTFQEDIGYYLNGFSNRLISGIFDPVECMSFCANETTFICRTAEIYLTGGSCYLSVDTAYTQPTARMASTSYNLYQRDCA